MITNAKRRPAGKPKKDGKALRETIRRAQQKAIERALARADGNVAEAAVALSIRRTSLYRVMKRLGIVPPTQPGGRTSP